jgi:TPR repeat protein
MKEMITSRVICDVIINSFPIQYFQIWIHSPLTPTQQEASEMLQVIDNLPNQKETRIETLKELINIKQNYQEQLEFLQNELKLLKAESNNLREDLSQSEAHNAIFPKMIEQDPNDKSNSINEAMDFLKTSFTDESQKKAASIFKEKADLGDPEGEWRYGCCLRNGWGVENDSIESKKYLERAANKGLRDGVFCLGRSYTCSSKEATFLFKSVADLSNAGAMSC